MEAIIKFGGPIYKSHIKEKDFESKTAAMVDAATIVINRHKRSAPYHTADLTPKTSAGSIWTTFFR